MTNLFSTEIIQIVDAIARDESISRNLLIEALEEAFTAAAKKKYGLDNNIRTEINKDIAIYRIRTIVEDVVSHNKEITIDDAKELDANAEIGGEIKELLPSIDFNRNSVRVVKEIIDRKVKEAKKIRQYDEYKDKIGTIVNGSIKRIDFNGVLVDLGTAEGIIMRKDQIPGEMFKINDRVKAYVKDVSLNLRDHQIVLSRAAPEFLEKLLTVEVPEIYDKIIQIKKVVRRPGKKAKVAVFSTDSSIDAVGCCVGPRGSRINIVKDELSGEKIDVIIASEDITEFASNALIPAKTTSVIFNEEKNIIEAITPQDQINLAIGSQGINVSLASRLVGYNIDVISEDEQSKRQQEEQNSFIKLAVEELDIEEMMARLIYAEGYKKIDTIAFASKDELLMLEGFNEEIVEELQNRANDYINKKNEKILSKLESLGVEQDLLDLLSDLPPEYILSLAEYGIKTIEDIEATTVKEFSKIIPSNILSMEKITQIIEYVKNQNTEQNDKE